MRVRCAWSVASLLHDTSLSLLSLCATLSAMRHIRFDMHYDILKVQQLVARFRGDVHTDQVHKNVMIECFHATQSLHGRQELRQERIELPTLGLSDLRAANCATAAVASVFVRALSRRKSKCLRD